MTQTIATTAGDTYQLTFSLGSANIYGSPSGITATADTATQTFTSTLNGSNNWETETLSFVASGATTARVTLAGQAGESYIGLDNVGVSGEMSRRMLPRPMFRSPRHSPFSAAA